MGTLFEFGETFIAIYCNIALGENCFSYIDIYVKTINELSG